MLNVGQGLLAAVLTDTPVDNLDRRVFREPLPQELSRYLSTTTGCERTLDTHQLFHVSDFPSCGLCATETLVYSSKAVAIGALQLIAGSAPAIKVIRMQRGWTTRLFDFGTRMKGSFRRTGRAAA